MRGVKYSAREKLKALRLWRQDHRDILWVAKRTKCTERTLWRWLAQYNGSLESLENASSRPHSPHPNAHTIEERQEIVEFFDKNPDISYTEAFSRLRAEYAYKRTYFGFWRYVRKLGIRQKIVEECEQYKPQPYNTPIMFGQKWQMDVKHVPVDCYTGNYTCRQDRKFFQYTMIDEATRERFLFAYHEIGSQQTVDFVKRAIVYFGYIPLKIQTDNGTEFTGQKTRSIHKLTHALDELLQKINIEHQLIRPYTPRHNGKVERSHRSDNENFYKNLKFSKLSELRDKMKEWNIRYNNCAHSGLRNKYGKRVWQTPLEKRAELEEQLFAHELDLPAPRAFTKYDKALAFAY